MTPEISPHRRNIPAGSLLIGAISLLALILFAGRVGLAWRASQDELSSLVFWYSTLPRGAIAVLSGAILGLAGALMQRVLRNPIADPSTLGIVSGAQLAMVASLIFAPSLMVAGREAVAFAGGALALAIVIGLSWRRSLDPITIVLSGMLVSLIAAALSATLILANGEYMMSIFIWGGGSLEQQDWAPSQSLLIRFFIAAVATLLLARPLQLLTLDDTNARALGLGVSGTRLAVLTVTVFLAASVTAEVGVIGFVGLAAANLARLAGARTLRQILIASPIVGAMLLLLTDGAVQLLSLWIGEAVPTGAATALLGGPLLLWLLPRLRSTLNLSASKVRQNLPRIGNWRVILPILIAVAVPVLLLALLFGNSGTDWSFATQNLDLVWQWRMPRVIAAIAAGAMLAAAGTLLQRITGNPLASPEVLGVSSGAGLGLAATLLLLPAASPSIEMVGATLGALLTLLLVMALSVRHRFAAERLLLAGIAVGASAGAVVTLVMARGGPESMRLLLWISGTIQLVSLEGATAALILGICLIAPLPFVARWLTILPLGGPFAQAVGLNRAIAASLLVLAAALLSAASTLFVGPFSFVGLMAPHMARLAGLSRPVPQLFGAVLIGAGLMVLADWLARTLAFPYQLPVGLIAALIGGPYIIWLLNRR